ncbi:MAG: ribulose-phosphate 3-epimerase [Lachnospiraceae bacterium]|nr:ribulose-phosphate 3-epimerase [Lachnospiraceae bacterium]
MRYLAPSLLSANFYNLENDLNILSKKNIKYLHLDVMDGMFVPNISIGIPVISSIKKNTKDTFILDTHLMIEKPERYIDNFKDAGADILTIHREISSDYLKVIDLIKDSGLKVGVSINPETDVNKIIDAIDKVDLILVMSVHPGFGGQQFIESSLEKIAFLNDLRNKNGYNYKIEVDGGIYVENVNKVINAGADIIVSGSGVFKGNISENIDRFMETFKE